MTNDQKKKTSAATWCFGAGDMGFTCVACTKPIEEGQHAMDFFWEGPHKRMWAHNDCVRAAMEKWIKTKENKAAK